MGERFGQVPAPATTRFDGIHDQRFRAWSFLTVGKTLAHYVMLEKAATLPNSVRTGSLKRLLAKAQSVGDDGDGAEAHRRAWQRCGLLSSVAQRLLFSGAGAPRLRHRPIEAPVRQQSPLRDDRLTASRREPLRTVDSSPPPKHVV